MRVWVNDCSAGGLNVYLVMVGPQVYDEFTSTRPLTWSEQHDVAAGYAEGLGYIAAGS